MNTAADPMVATLPPALQPWRAWLQWFEPDLAAQLGDWLRRLDPLLGRYRGQCAGGEPEPDGLGDLHRRGRYERLLSSEWLLADELPDEFLRRAASGEHLFLAPRPRARQADRLVVALFDSGPLQLGAPRLAHLAMWILLARRAQAAGGVMRWGVLQRPGVWREAESPEDLRALMASRDFDLAGPSDAEAWTAALADMEVRPGECWCVGPTPRRGEAPVLDALQATHRLHISRDLSGTLLDMVCVDGHSRRTMQLTLPPAVQSVPLLQGAFLRPVSHPGQAHLTVDGRISLKRPPIISPDGRQMAVMSLDEPGMWLFSIPRNAKGKPRSRLSPWTSQWQPLSACFGGKQLAGLLAHGEQLRFWQVFAMGVVRRPPQEEFSAAPGTAAWLPMIWLRDGNSKRMCVLDQANRLRAWSVWMERPGQGEHARFPEVPTAAQELISTHVLGCALWTEAHGVYVVQSQGQLWLHWVGVKDKSATGLSLGPAEGCDRVFFANRPKVHGGEGACAVRCSGSPQEIWRVRVVAALNLKFDPGCESFELALPEGWRAVGLAYSAQRGGFGMVALAANGRCLHWLSSSGSIMLHDAVATVTSATVCPHTGTVALLTSDFGLQVYSLPDEVIQLRARSQPKDAHAGE